MQPYEITQLYCMVVSCTWGTLLAILYSEPTNKHNNTRGRSLYALSDHWTVPNPHVNRRNQLGLVTFTCSVFSSHTRSFRTAVKLTFHSKRSLLLSLCTVSTFPLSQIQTSIHEPSEKSPRCKETTLHYRCLQCGKYTFGWCLLVHSRGRKGSVPKKKSVWWMVSDVWNCSADLKGSAVYTVREWAWLRWICKSMNCNEVQVTQLNICTAVEGQRTYCES